MQAGKSEGKYIYHTNWSLLTATVLIFGGFWYFQGCKGSPNEKAKELLQKAEKC